MKFNGKSKRRRRRYTGDAGKVANRATERHNVGKAGKKRRKVLKKRRGQAKILEIK